MEILNNIWVALNTENEALTNTILFPFNFIEAYLSLVLFTMFLNIKYSKKEEYLYVVLASIISLLTGYIFPHPFSTLINYIALIVIIYKLFDLSILKTILAIILPCITWAIVSTLIINPIIKVLNIDPSLLNTIPLYSIIYLFVLYGFVLLFIYIFKIANINLNLSIDMNKSTKMLIIVNLVLRNIYACSSVYYKCFLY